VKERLTGAIILVALIVLLVPELLTGPVRSAARATSVSASSEEPPLRSYTINLDDAHAHPAAAATSDPQPAAPLPGSAATPDTNAASPAATAQPSASDPSATTNTPATPPAATAPSSTPAPSAPTPAPRASAHVPVTHAAAPSASPSAPPAESGAYLVQLGSFASHDNAEHLAQQVRAQGFTVSVSQGSSGRRLYRVRVGPAHDREAALKLAQRLQGLGHSGAVVPK
jgi:DedD protein